MESKCLCHSCGTEVSAKARRCPSCYVALEAATRAPSPLRAAPSAAASSACARGPARPKASANAPSVDARAPGGPIGGTVAPARAAGTAAAATSATATIATAIAEVAPHPMAVGCPVCETTVMPVAGWCPSCMEPLAVDGAPASPLPPGWDLEDFEVFGLEAPTEAGGAQIITGPWPARRNTVTYASWHRRAVAALIDGAAFVPALVALAINPVVGVIVLVVAVAFSGWQCCYLQGRTGQTIGKHVMGIFLVGESTLVPMGPRRAALRQLAHAIDAALLGIGYLWPLWDPKHQTFADQLFSTVVVAG